MATYSFDTITAAQALAFAAGDVLSVTGTASSVTIAYEASGLVLLTVGARTVEFAAALETVSQAGGVVFSDGSVLFVGTDASENKDYGIFGHVSGAFFGGGGDDNVQTGQGSFLVQGNAGNDKIRIGAGGNNTVYGGQGNDSITISADFGVVPGHNFAQGNLGDDTIRGGLGGDTLLGGKGDDSIVGGGQNDFLNGNLGNDVIVGSGQLFGEDGNDTIVALSTGPSTVFGGAGNDRLSSAAVSPNTLPGAPTLMFGEDGDDLINLGSSAHDEAHGGAGNDTIVTNNGGQDSLDGGDGNDSLSADDAAQTSLNGGAGDDTIAASGFGDVLSGGGGADKFMLFATAFSSAEDNAFQITDWSSTDHISISGIDKSYYQELTAPDYQTALAQYCLPMAPHAVVAVQVGADVVVFAETGSANVGIGHFQAAILVGRTLDDIDASNLVVG